MHEHVGDASRHLVRRCTDVGDPGRKAGLIGCLRLKHVALTEGAVRHYESGIRAVKPELLESIAAALDVTVNALKDYGVETAGDLISLLVRLEDSFGIVPAADGMGLSLNAKAPHAAKAATAIKLWAEKRARLENGEIDAAEYEDWKASL